MENIWAIITKPDNIPIVALIFLLCFFSFITFQQAFRNDRRLKQEERRKGEQ
ncbi:hypothetical protein [Candidatus Kuenenia sp.]|uniref:hypothetical protein n=1 Tax=Candidatus Kuenenia sp. TaxID=2499824 RepID=UPI0032203F26